MMVGRCFHAGVTDQKRMACISRVEEIGLVHPRLDLGILEIFWKERALRPWSTGRVFIVPMP